VSSQTLPEPLDLAEGTMVGEYRITGVLGRGGMGTVYAGIHPVIEKRVAIKVLTEYSGRSDIIDRFVQEARAANRIGHANIVDIFSFGQLGDGRHYFVMEYVAGRPLTALLRERAPLRFDEALPILRGIAEGLTAAHDKGIVHRDLKPDNVFLVERPGSPALVKILDFGIAKLVTPEGGSRTRTRTGTSLGTPLYMSPEQCRGDSSVDQRSDIYSFGVICFLAFTGRVPFDAESHVDVIYMHVHAPPPPPSVLSGMPLPLEVVILKALAKKPEDRYERLDQMMEALAAMPPEVHAWEPVRAAPVDAAGATKITRVSRPGEPHRSATYLPPRSQIEPAGLRLGWVLGVTAGLLAVGVAIGVVMLVARRAAAPHPPAASAAPAGTGRFVIVSNPAGAEVWVNGTRHPEPTPTEIGGLPRGQRVSIELRKSGYRPWSDRRALALDVDKEVIDAQLTAEGPPPGSVEVHTNVKQATFMLDGRKVGDRQGELAVSAVPAGEHALRVESRGYLPIDRMITVSPEKLSSLELKLERERPGHPAPRPDPAQKDETIDPFRGLK
jgi:serine/threonine-protein kinase